MLPIIYGLPSITSYPDIACLLAIAGSYTNTAYEKKFLDWYSMQYLSLSMIIPYDSHVVNVIYDNAMNEGTIKTSYIIQKERHSLYDLNAFDFSIFVKKQINEGHSVFLQLDQKFFYDREMSYYHETFIPTYDKADNSFEVYDFWNLGRYSSMKVTADQLNQAFISVAKYSILYLGR